MGLQSTWSRWTLRVAGVMLGLSAVNPTLSAQAVPRGALTSDAEIDLVEAHALALLRANQPRAAEAEFLRVLTARRRIDGPDSAATWDTAILLAGDYVREQRLDEAMALFSPIVAVGEARYAAGHEDNDDGWGLYVSALSGMAQVHGARQEIAEAERLYLRSIALWGSNALFANSDRQQLAALYREAGRTAEADALETAATAAQSAADEAERLAEANPVPEPGLSQTSRAIALIDGARRSQELRHFGDAERDLLAAIRLVDSTAGPDYVVAITGRQTLAGLYVEIGRYSEAEALYRQTLDAHRRTERGASVFAVWIL